MLFPADIFPELGLPNDFLGMNCLHFADNITTVSPTYAKKIQSHEVIYIVS